MKLCTLNVNIVQFQDKQINWFCPGGSDLLLLYSGTQPKNGIDFFELLIAHHRQGNFTHCFGFFVTFLSSFKVFLDSSLIGQNKSGLTKINAKLNS